MFDLRIRPSAADRWTRCHGSVYYDLTMLNISSKAAERGTALHEESERRLQDSAYQHATLNSVDAYMVDFYVQYVNSMVAPGGKLYVEQKLKWSDVCYGTADAVIVNGDDLKLIDLKTGQKRVTAEGNKQLMLYLAMAVQHFGIDPEKGEMSIEIVQPISGGGVDVYTVPAAELAEFVAEIADHLAAIVIERAHGGWTFEPSYEACHWCLGKAVCKARQEDLMKDFGTEPATAMEDLDLSDVLKKAANLKSWIAAVEDYALARAVEGLEIDGFVLGKKTTFRKWGDPEAVTSILEDYGFTEDDEVWTRKLASPARILDSIDDDVLIDELGALVVKPEGAPVLKKK